MHFAILERHYKRDTDLQIHSLACAEWDGSLSLSGTFPIPLCCTSISISSSLFPPTSLPSSLTSSCHFFLVYLSILFFTNSYVIFFWGILFSSILCSCSNQRNLFNFIVTTTVGFLTMHENLYWLISSNFLFSLSNIQSLKSDLKFACEISVIPTATISDIPSLSVRSQQLYTPSID